MLRAMSTASSGMQGQQAYIDTLANNLANVNTPGFKASRVEFQDLLYENVVPAGGVRASGQVEPSRVEVGHGVRIAGTTKLFTQGLIEATGNPLDIMVEGDGFFQLRLPGGNLGYTRDGTFKLNSQRQVVTSQGFELEPALTIPEDAVEISVAKDGSVSVRLSGDDSTIQEIGSFELARFPNAAGLESAGGNHFRETVNSGPPLLGRPGEIGFGTVSPGYLEKSNVQVVTELVNMITAQRAYELNSKSIQTADEMLQTANAIRR